ncbi:sensor histidine kinase [Planotetraspora silvatica]|uniref:sensor histidine kinase n=1 Tax=Planotetraspora silvatica TaxID=234614 RepID=UPI001EF35ED0|nr:GAF domain-containing protein [Planotetraspora silvatica]
MTGILIGVLLVAVETLVANPLTKVAPPSSLCIVYLPGVLVVSLLWGWRLGTLTALASAFAFGYFLVLKIATGPEWVALAVFLVVAVLTGSFAALARSAAVDAEERRREASLAAELAGLLLNAEDLCVPLRTASDLLAVELGAPGLTIQLEPITDDRLRTAVQLRNGDRTIGRVAVPKDLPEPALQRVHDLLPCSLSALLQAALDRESITRALKTSHDELQRVADEQAALRRVATLVAHRVAPEELFGAVADEMGRVLKVDHTAITRFDPDGTFIVVGSWSVRGPDFVVPEGTRWSADEPSVAGMVRQTRRPARMTDYATTAGAVFERSRKHGVNSAVGIPIVVEGRLWGATVALSSEPDPPACVEAHMLEFTELVATAIANAQVRQQLAASRARVVAAADETRRRIERDLHDGTQQRLISLGLRLRSVEAAASPEMTDLRKQLSCASEDLAGVVEDLQELSRGLHPVIVSRGGLASALRTLARRSAVPVELSVIAPRRLAENIEVTTYYIVSEALTNVAKHARATIVHVDLAIEDSRLCLSVRDDGIGGADPVRGSGLIGLRDRVEVLGGTMEISSPPGGGTSMLVAIPTPADDPGKG